jgi:hypothetical protein
MERFHYSLVSISKTNEDIVCYCSYKEIDILKKILLEFSITNVTLKEFELENLPFHSIMKGIRLSNPQKFFEFPHEVMWAKYYFLNLEFDESYDYHYWIDAGLSHSGLFPIKYNSGGFDGMSSNPETYNYPKIFNENLFTKINNFSSDKLLNITTRTIGFNVDDIITYLEVPNIYFESLTIGGIVGGNSRLIKWYCEKYFEYGDLCLKNNYILDNEQILGAITHIHPDNFNTFIFDTWYHEDWKNWPSFEDFDFINQIPFVRFFEII